MVSTDSMLFFISAACTRRCVFLKIMLFSPRLGINFFAMHKLGVAFGLLVILLQNLVFWQALLPVSMQQNPVCVEIMQMTEHSAMHHIPQCLLSNRLQCHYIAILKRIISIRCIQLWIVIFVICFIILHLRRQRISR